MSSSTKTPTTSISPAIRRGWTDLFRDWRQHARQSGPRGRVRLLWWLLTVVNVGLLAWWAWWLVCGRPSVAPPASRRIVVPYAEIASVWEPWHRWVVQEDGRLKPFETFAAESVRTITGRERFEGNDPVAVVLSWLLADPSAPPDSTTSLDWDHYPCILCDHHELRAVLYREWQGDDTPLSEEELHGKYVEPAVLRSSSKFKELLRSGAAKTDLDDKAEQTSLERKAAEVKKRLGLFERIRGGGQAGRERIQMQGEFGVVALERDGGTWFSLRSVTEYARRPEAWLETMAARRVDDSQQHAKKPLPEFPAEDVLAVQMAHRELEQAYRSGDETQFREASRAFQTTLTDVNLRAGVSPRPPLLSRELWFNAVNPFRMAWIVALGAAVCLAVSLMLGASRGGRWLYATGMLGFAACLGCAAVGFWCRVTISGRPPVSNMYESIVWVAFMSAVFGFVLEMIYRRGVIALAGATASTLGFVLADQLPLTFAPNIQPLQAVLRSNYWLVIHVLTIVSSYAAFALAWMIGNFNLAVLVLAPWRTDLTKPLSAFCYRAIQIGVVLLAAGTLLGGFWAAESWGRFWGWDPKEVWALIALLCYVIPLHARYVGWVREFGLSVCAVVCFASVVMAWYGVNFVLGAGLHSYGFGGGDDAWVYLGGLINLSLVAHAAARRRYVPAFLVP
jgi:ABC-type transport system involved in cytochrome c biogenesis permease subunit